MGIEGETHPEVRVNTTEYLRTIGVQWQDRRTLMNFELDVNQAIAIGEAGARVKARMEGNKNADQHTARQVDGSGDADV